MKWSNSATVLVVLLLVFGALLLRQVEYRHYSDEEVEDTMSTLCEEYALLQERHASDEEWRDFAQKASEITEPIVTDMENPNLPPSLLHDFVRNQLPQAIAGNGKVPATVLVGLVASVKEMRQTQLEQELASRREQGAFSDESSGPLTVASYIVNAALVLCLGYILLDALRSWYSGRLGNLEDTLRRLNEKLEKDPASVRNRGLRARLLTRLGCYAEAISDIDWILAHQPQGTDVEPWRRLREVAVQKQTPSQ